MRFRNRNSTPEIRNRGLSPKDHPRKTTRKTIEFFASCLVLPPIPSRQRTGANLRTADLQQRIGRANLALGDAKLGANDIGAACHRYRFMEGD